MTATEVFGYGHGTGLSGKKPSSVTIGARIACLSSFYRFLIRMGLEVWPESHWPGFALRQTDVLESYVA